MYIALAVLFVAFMLLLAFCLCKVAARADAQSEATFAELQARDCEQVNDEPRAPHPGVERAMGRGRA